MTRIQEIMALLEGRGPMTVVQIAAELGVSETTANTHIHTFRKLQKGIRVSGYVKTGPTKKHRLYAIGDRPDMPYPNPRRAPSALARIKYPGLSREEIAERRRLKELAAQAKPFRDPMIFMTAGRPA